MNRTRSAVASAVALAAILGSAGTAGAAPDPLKEVNGNNGTVKADVAGCAVTVDWYGMDPSATTTVEFRLHGGSGDALLLTDTFTLDGDGASGGDLDGSRTYDLSGPVVAHGDASADSHQVKVTTHTTYSQGADTKYKVVSVSGCEVTDPEV
jgi:hypothetical protein